MLDAKLKQDLFQAVYDKLSGVTLPDDGNFDEVLGREIDRAVDWVENRIKTSLTPARVTDLPASAQQAYEDKTRFNNYITVPYNQYPQWNDLTLSQKAIYGNNSTIYTAGSLPWQYLTEQQMVIFSSNVQYSSIKTGDAERQDGKNSSYIKTYKRPIIQVYYLALSFVTPPGYENRNLFFRQYMPNEFYVYNKEGGIHIFPAVMARISNTTQDPLYGSQYGVVAPRIPQVLKIDYEYGYTDQTRPIELVEAVALRASINILMYMSAFFTGGLSGFGVQGFNASFDQRGMYAPLIQYYQDELKHKLLPFIQIVMTGW